MRPVIINDKHWGIIPEVFREFRPFATSTDERATNCSYDRQYNISFELATRVGFPHLEYIPKNNPFAMPHFT
jgi:hypothetical protein